MWRCDVGLHRLLVVNSEVCLCVCVYPWRLGNRAWADGRVWDSCFSNTFLPFFHSHTRALTFQQAWLKRGAEGLQGWTAGRFHRPRDQDHRLSRSFVKKKYPDPVSTPPLSRFYQGSNGWTGGGEHAGPSPIDRCSPFVPLFGRREWDCAVLVPPPSSLRSVVPPQPPGWSVEGARAAPLPPQRDAPCAWSDLEEGEEKTERKEMPNLSYFQPNFRLQGNLRANEAHTLLKRQRKRKLARVSWLNATWCTVSAMSRGSCSSR